MFKQLKKLQKDSQGFTLVELMIVVAIIGILAAIAIPQFAAYRTRSFNANGKALNKQAVNSSSDLNAELGCYGHTSAAAALLTAASTATGTGAASVSITIPALATGATPTIAGGRLSGLNTATTKQFSVPLGIGSQMTLQVMESPVAAGACASGGCSNVIFARAEKGDTAYGSDSDAANALYSVSNPTWAADAVAGLQALIAAVAPTDAVNNFDADGIPTNPGPAGGGQPTTTWQITQ